MNGVYPACLKFSFMCSFISFFHSCLFTVSCIRTLFLMSRRHTISPFWEPRVRPLPTRSWKWALIAKHLKSKHTAHFHFHYQYPSQEVQGTIYVAPSSLRKFCPYPIFPSRLNKCTSGSVCFLFMSYLFSILMKLFSKTGSSSCRDVIIWLSSIWDGTVPVAVFWRKGAPCLLLTWSI